MVGVVVLVLAIVALHDPKNPSSSRAASTNSPSTHSTSSSSSPSSRTPSSGADSSPTTGTSSSAPRLTDAQLKSKFPLVVLNSTDITGLAADAAQNFEQGGWTVSSTGNLVNDILSTCAYYDPSVRHAKEAATALRRQFPAIQRVEPKFSGLAAGSVVVVLTSDYSSG